MKNKVRYALARGYLETEKLLLCEHALSLCLSVKSIRWLDTSSFKNTKMVKATILKFDQMSGMCYPVGDIMDSGLKIYLTNGECYAIVVKSAKLSN